MSLLDYVFQNGMEVEKQSSTQTVKILKYQYDSRLSPMQNAYLEINSRFNGNSEVSEIRNLVDKYKTCVENSNSGVSACNGMLNDKLDRPCGRILNKNALDLSIRHDPTDSFVKLPCVDKDYNNNINKHTMAIQNLETSCPNYHLLQDEPNKRDICYLAALDYWKFVTNGYLANLRLYGNYTDRSLPVSLEQSDRSDLLRKYYFNDSKFSYPKYGNIK